MSIESPFSDALKNAVQARRALVSSDQIQNWWRRAEEEVKLITIYESCPAFRCGNLVVIYENGVVKWGSSAKQANIEALNATRGCLFLFSCEETTAACFQMDDGAGRHLYHSLGEAFIPFLRAQVFPGVFKFFHEYKDILAHPDTTPVFITDKDFMVLDADFPTV